MSGEKQDVKSNSDVKDSLNEATNNAPPGDDHTSNLDSATAIDSSEEKKGLESAVEIPQEVDALLRPISSDKPTGDDVEASSENYIKLKIEVEKPQPDYGIIIEMASDFLRGESKHLRVGLWLCHAWYRTESIHGLRNGMILVTELIKQYSDKLYPVIAANRGRSLLFFNKNMLLFLKKETATAENFQQWLDIKKVFDQLLKLSGQQFTEKPPNLQELSTVITSLAKKSEQFIKKEESTKEVKQTTEESAKQEAKTATTTKPAPPPVPPPLGAAPTSDKMALFDIQNSLMFFFKDETPGHNTERVPEDSYIYGMSRLLQWGRVKMPLEKDKITQLEGPNKQRQNFIQGLFANNDWDRLIANVEVDFLRHDWGKYWVDAQRLVVLALEQKGGVFGNAALEIKIHLDRLLQRLPALTKLIFMDKQTPFAGKETLLWLDDEVKGASGGGSSTDTILPPIMGEDYEPINKAYEAAVAQLPENFEKNAREMQLSIDGDTRQKGQFLRMLCLANYCYTAKHNEVAEIILNQLMQKIKEFNITAWEPALCTSVWQSKYLTNIKLQNLTDDNDKKAKIEKEQEALFKRIAAYDLVLAQKLSDRKPKEGE